MIYVKELNIIAGTGGTQWMLNLNLTLESVSWKLVSIGPIVEHLLLMTPLQMFKDNRNIPYPAPPRVFSLLALFYFLLPFLFFRHFILQQTLTCPVLR